MTRILAKHGIETKVKLPGVGENLQDQPNVALVYPSKINATGIVPYATFINAYDMFGDETASVAASTNCSLSKWARVVSDASEGAISSEVLEKLFGVQHDLIFRKNVTIAETLTVARENQLISVFWLLLPFSRGSVHLKRPDAIDHPAIDPKFFLIDFDLVVQILIGRLSQKLWYTAPTDALLAPGTPSLYPNATDDEWRAYLNANC